MAKFAKWTLGLMICAMVLCAALALPQETAYAKGVGDYVRTAPGEIFSYRITKAGAEAEVTGCDWENGGAITVPSTIRDIDDGITYTVTAIADMDSWSDFSSVVLPNTITAIKKYAFSDCSSLQSITIPSSVKIIEDYAFDSCTSLTSIIVPDTVKTLGMGVFQYCDSLRSVTLPSWMKEIPDSMFYNCAGLTSVNIPSGVTVIREWAFYGCASLPGVTMPAALTTVETNAFRKCNALKSVSFTSASLTIGERAFSECAALSALTSKGTSLILEWGAFYESGLTGATLTASQIRLDGSAFSYNESLKTVTITGATTFSGGSISDCGSLSTVTVNGNAAFSSNTFSSSDNLTTITVNGNAAIADSAFRSLAGLSTFKVTGTVTQLGKNAFASCPSLTSVSLPGVKDVGEWAFDSCVSLKTITLPNTVTIIRSGAFSGCVSLTSFVVPPSTHTLGTSVFSGCSNLQSLTLSPKLTYIPDSMCYKNSRLQKIIIPTGVEEIGAYAFEQNLAMTWVSIPATCNKIAARAFNGCIALKDMYLYRPMPPYAETLCFGQVPTTCILHVPVKATAYEVWEMSVFFTLRYDLTGSAPTVPPSSNTTPQPTAKPTAKPTANPTAKPTTAPTQKPPAGTYAISVSANNAAYGKVSGGGSYASGKAVTLVATPNAGYRFVRWLENGAEVSAGYQYQFTVSKARTLVAEFAKVGVPAVKAASGGYDRIALTWNAVPGAKGYEIWCKTGSGKFAKVGTSARPAFTHTKRKLNTKYSYKVRAYCVAGSVTTYGADSAVKSAKPVPAASKKVTAKAGAGSVKLTWTVVPGATKYEVYQSTSPKSGFKRVGDVKGKSFTAKKLKKGKAFYFKVRAYRLVGKTKVYGAYSAVAFAKAK